VTVLHKYMAERSAALALALLSLYVFFFFVYLQTRFLQGGLDHPLLVVALVATFLVLAFRGRASYALAVLVPVVGLVAARLLHRPASSPLVFGTAFGALAVAQAHALAAAAPTLLAADAGAQIRSVLAATALARAAFLAGGLLAVGGCGVAFPSALPAALVALGVGAMLAATGQPTAAAWAEAERHLDAHGATAGWLYLFIGLTLATLTPMGCADPALTRMSGSARLVLLLLKQFATMGVAWWWVQGVTTPPLALLAWARANPERAAGTTHLPALFRAFATVRRDDGGEGNR